MKVIVVIRKNALIKLTDEGVLVRHQGKGAFVNQDILKQKISSNHSIKMIDKQKKGVIGFIIPTLNMKVGYLNGNRKGL